MPRRSFVLLAVILLAISGCDITGLRRSAVGVYQVQSVDGFALPVYWSEDVGAVFDLVGETVTLAKDGTLQRVIRVRRTLRGTGRVSSDSLVDRGTYTVSGSNLVVRFGSEAYKGAFGGSTLSIDFLGLVHFYRK